MSDCATIWISRWVSFSSNCSAKCTARFIFICLDWTVCLSSRFPSCSKERIENCCFCPGSALLKKSEFFLRLWLKKKTLTDLPFASLCWSTLLHSEECQALCTVCEKCWQRNAPILTWAPQTTQKSAVLQVRLHLAGCNFTKLHLVKCCS